MDDTTNVDKLNRQLALRKAPGPEDEESEAIAYRAYEFDAHGVEHNHRYASAAVVAGRRAIRASARPGAVRPADDLAPAARTPGDRDGRHVSTWTWPGRQRVDRHRRPALARCSTARRPAARRRLVGPGQPFEDPYGTWAELRESLRGGVS